MATPVIEYIEAGLIRVFHLTTISALPAVTATEINAGTELTKTTSGGLKALEGFDFQNEGAPVMSLGDNFEGKVVGLDRAGTPTLRFNRAGHAIDNVFRLILAKGAAGYLAIFYQGTAGATPAATDRCEVWQGRSSGPVRDHPSGNEIATWHCSWSVPVRPLQDVILT